MGMGIPKKNYLRSLRGDMGQLIPFTSGIVRITLHFRCYAIL